MTAQRAGASREREEGRGREARRPTQIPKRGWRDVLLRVKSELSKDNLSIVAAGVAFFWLVAIFPAIAGLVGVYGMVTEPQQVEQQIRTAGTLLPPEAQTIMNEQASRIVSQSSDTLQLAAILGFLGSLWAAAKGTKALMQALNIAYDEPERRGFVRLNGMALLLTFGAIVAGIIALGLVIAAPALLGSVGLGETVRTVVSWARWPVLAALLIVALGVIYRYGPARDAAEWRWVNPGAVTATVLWLVASALFSWYVSNFGNYNETYGSVGAIVILLMWFFLTAYVVLLGAELNSEMEHQTRVDTTVGEPRPMGERGAYAADTLGETP